MPADKKADEIWLRNTSDEIVHAQVRVYHWSQDQGEDVLTPEQSMVASPPMVQIEPGQQQLVRVVRIGPLATPAATERAYRLLIDELPIQRDIKRAGLNFVFRYSVPVFVAGTTDAKPLLDWAVQQKGQKAWLRVANTGTGHAQLANVEFMPVGGKTVMAANGLAGYVLPGHYRSIE
ncbi:MAG TPA: fimbria/pilus periplasmic chaperone, partial [Castellaniella sp.]|nr:fimbria/pilus periplasmic chaperone [Castellaniella sp.]